MGSYTRLPLTSILSLDVLIHALEASLGFVVIASESEPQEPGPGRDKVGELVATELLDELGVGERPVPDLQKIKPTVPGL